MSRKRISLKSPYHLTSEVITSRQDGYYPFPLKTLLLTHESVRRELIRGVNGLKSITLTHEKKDWHVKYFHDWSLNVLLPVIHSFCETEKFFFDIFTNYGVTFPPHHVEDHINISSKLLELEKLQESLAPYITAVDCYNGLPIHLIDEKIANINKCYEELYQIVKQHLMDVENVWASLLEEQGKQKICDAEQATVQWGLEHGGERFHVAVASICDAIGMNKSDFSLLPDEKPWAGEGVLHEYLLNFPIITRNLQLPSWNHKYLRYKLKINSCGADEILVDDTNSKCFAAGGCIIV